MILGLLATIAFFTSPPLSARGPIHQSAQGLVLANLPATKVKAVGPIGMTVSDMDRAIDFYSNVLSFEQTADIEVAGEEFEHLEGVFGLRMRVVTMKLGKESIQLSEYLTPKGRPVPVDSRSNDHWFQHIAIIVSDMDKAYAWLRQHKVQHASTGPQRIPDWNRTAAGVRAFYFKDPDGHTLEVLAFPPDKGKAEWHQKSDRLFLGIDHTAIVIGDTETSLAFYRDALGFEVGGQSENYGVEQEHLNNVFGARLRITSIHTNDGPSIEFLEYLAPRDGRPIPVDLRANDVTHWQTHLVANSPEAVVHNLVTRRYSLVSPGLVSFKDHSLGFSGAFLVRDPDGHVLEISN
jgi:catechol 2,3-dioxygenase-like lactoylglutathione lyase family enzyme